MFIFLAQDFRLFGGGQELNCLWQGSHHFLPALVLITSRRRIWAKFITTMPTREFSPLTHETPALIPLHANRSPEIDQNTLCGSETFAPGASCHRNKINGNFTTNFKQIQDQAQNYLLRFHTYIETCSRSEITSQPLINEALRYCCELRRIPPEQ